MHPILEMILSVLMLVFWAVELLENLISREFFLILFSFGLLLLWVDELFPFRKDFRISFMARLYITIIVVLIQQIARLFI